MKVEHLTNRSATTLNNEVLSAFDKSRTFSIATAFINDEAISIIENVLNKRNSRTKGKILTGLYSNFNKKKDLERLLSLANKYPHKLQVHISLDRCFHWKFYQFNTGRQQVYYIGSANFTTSGLADNSELVVKLSSTSESHEQPLENLLKSFEKEWIHSQPLAEFPLKHYREVVQTKGPVGGAPQEIKSFFEQEIGDPIEVSDNGKLYAIALYVDAKPATYRAVRNQKGQWLRNEWDWFILPARRDFDVCCKHKFLIVFSKEGRDKVYSHYSERMGEDANMKTADGNYFIAYKIVRSKRLSREQLEVLRQRPFCMDLIGWKDPFYQKVLGTNQTKTLKALLDFKI